jgi:hypothetical protein
MQKTNRNLFGFLAIFGGLALPAFAQPHYPPDQLNHLVDRIALYPDPLLAQILTGSTFSNQIPDAADYAGHHRYLNGDALSSAIQADNLPWDPSVVALIPFPSVLDMMASDMGWTQQLGDAVLAQRGDVMDAVQQMRRRAYDYGYLRTNANIRVNYGPYIEIVPVSPGYYLVPRYDPLVVFAAPRPGFFVGGAIGFGPRIFIGASFAPWGWGGPGFGWGAHTIIIDHHPWDRTWVNRAAYIHPYAAPYRRAEYHPGARVVESHPQARQEHERREEHHVYREERR